MGISQILLASLPATNISNAFSVNILLKEQDGSTVLSIANGNTISGTGDSSLAANTAINMLESNAVTGLNRYVQATATNFVAPISYNWVLSAGGSPAYSLGKNSNGTINSSITTVSGTTATIYTSSPGDAVTSTRVAQLTLVATDAHGSTTSTTIGASCIIYGNAAISVPQLPMQSYAYEWGPASATVSLTFTASGLMLYDTYDRSSGTYGTVHPTIWATPRPTVNPGNYEIFVSVISGTTPTGILNTWLPLNVDRTWTLSTIFTTVFVSADAQCSLQVSIRVASNHLLTVTGGITMNAHVYSPGFA
jgi:hypothetical protein